MSPPILEMVAKMSPEEARLAIEQKIADFENSGVMQRLRRNEQEKGNLKALEEAPEEQIIEVAEVVIFAPTCRQLKSTKAKHWLDGRPDLHQAVIPYSGLLYFQSEL